MTKAQKAVEAAKRRGLISKAQAKEAKALLAKPKRARKATAPVTPAEADAVVQKMHLRKPDGEPAKPTPEEAAWAAFKRYHGSCAKCRGEDPFCSTLGVGTRRGLPWYDPEFGGHYRVVETVREIVRRRMHPTAAPMTEEVKQRLRARAVEQREASGKKPDEGGARRVGSLSIVREGVAAGLSKDAIVAKLKASGIKSGDPWEDRVDRMLARIKEASA